MSQSPDQSHQTRFLLTNLIIISIFALTLVFLVAGYPLILAPDPTATPTITPTFPPTASLTPSATITLTPTPTATHRPTQTPTTTLTPTITPTPAPTETPPGPPTLTPAKPVKAGPELYRLAEWTPEKAQQLIDLLNDYPNTLTRQERGENQSGYYAAFSYAVDVQKEALLRFPQAPQAEAWRWGLAYNLARSGNLEAGEQYANLVLEALNQGQVDLPGLPKWFQEHEPRGTLSVIEVDTPSGYESSALLEVHLEGSAYIRLLKTATDFQSEVLTSQFDFVHSPKTGTVISDFNGDGLEDVAIYFSNPAGDLLQHTPLVFDLSQVPAQRLPFQPSSQVFSVGTDFQNFWSATPGQGEASDLVFDVTVFPACPVAIRRVYRWDGSVFYLQDASYSAQPSQATLELCPYTLESAIQAWGPGAASNVLQDLLPIWQPIVDENGKTRPEYTQEALRYRLGIYQALDGQLETARQTLNSLIQQPVTPEDSWAQAAQRFLDTFQEPQDLYRACTQAPDCIPFYALKSLVESQASESPSQVIQTLREAGVSISASGTFDFDSDGEAETWLTVRYLPGEKLELWILATSGNGTQALRVGAVDSSKPDFVYLDEERDPPVVQADGITFRMLRDSGSRVASLEFVDFHYQWRNPYQEGLTAAINALYQGEDPRKVQRTLLNLQNIPGLMCAPYWTCDPYYYYLGLSSELAGDREQAIDAYLYLWWNYSKSPFTTAARLKLLGKSVSPSGTPSTTRTPTGTPHTPTPSATPATPYP